MFRLIAAIAVLLSLSSCARERKAETPRSPNAPVILISIDTLRSDHLPAYGYTGVQTPHLDQFRRDAVLFTRAWSPTPMTLPSHVSMLNGLLPNRHGVRDNVGFRYDSARFPSVPQILQRRGYRTGAAVSSYVLRGESGMASAFESYDDSIEPPPGAAFAEYQRTGDVTLRSARKWIDANSGQPFFYFFHIYEPHVPYDPPEPFRSRFASAYDGEIASADAIVGELLTHLRQRGLYEGALVIVTSDHGEGLGDHGEEQHSVLVYREALQVPLFIKFPGSARAGTTVDVPVQLSDLAPTILAVLDVSTDTKFDGVSLADAAPAADRFIYGESLFPLLHLGWSELRSIVQGNYHFIEAPRPELYDFVQDPREKVNLIDRERRVATALRNALKSFEAGDAQPSVVDEESARRLAALGYLGAPAAGKPTRANPIERIHLLNDIRSAFQLAGAGKDDEAIGLMRELLQKEPDVLDVRIRLAEVLSNANRMEEAAAEYREVLRRSAVSLPDVALQAAGVLLRMSRFDEAEKYARQASREVPDKAYELLARIAMARGDLRAASEAAETAYRASSSPSHLVLQAEIALRRNDSAQALALLDQAEQLGREKGLANVYRLNFVRANVMAQMGRVAEAIAAQQREIELFPSNLDAYASLAVLHLLQGNRAELDAVIERMVRANPTGRAREIAARTYEAMGEPRAAARWRRR